MKLIEHRIEIKAGSESRLPRDLYAGEPFSEQDTDFRQWLRLGHKEIGIKNYVGS